MLLISFPFRFPPSGFYWKLIPERFKEAITFYSNGYYLRIIETLRILVFSPARLILVPLTACILVYFLALLISRSFCRRSFLHRTNGNLSIASGFGSAVKWVPIEWVQILFFLKITLQLLDHEVNYILLICHYYHVFSPSAYTILVEWKNS